MAGSDQKESPSQVENTVVAALRDATSKKAEKSNFHDILIAYREQFLKIRLPQADVESDQARRDAVREKICLNGVNFVSYEELFFNALDILSRNLVASVGWDESRASKIVEELLSKSSRTASGSDSYFLAQDLFGMDGFFFKPRHDPLPPISLSLLAVRDNIIAQVSSTNYYGLYKMEEIDDIAENGGALPEPWLQLDTVVFENIDFGKSKSVRFMDITSPDVDYSLDVSQSRMTQPEKLEKLEKHNKRLEVFFSKFRRESEPLPIENGF